MAEPRKPVITTSGLSPELARAIEPIKQSVEMLVGTRAGVRELKGLKKDSSASEIVEKVNEIIARLNASGKYNV